MSRYKKIYCEDNLKKYCCTYCEKEFIVGAKTSENIDLTCPYCKCDDVVLISYTDDEKLESMSMGCIGIAFDMSK